MIDHTLEECRPLVVVSALAMIPAVSYNHYSVSPQHAQYHAQLAVPQCIYVFRVWSIAGRKTSVLWFFIFCLGGYLAVTLWSATDNLVVADGAFHLLPKTGCYRVTYHNYPPLAVRVFVYRRFQVISLTSNTSDPL